MKKLILYVCGHCGTQYKEEKKCKECEKKHQTEILSVQNQTHHAGGDYPDRIEVLFKSGKSIWYHR